MRFSIHWAIGQDIAWPLEGSRVGNEPRTRANVRHIVLCGVRLMAYGVLLPPPCNRAMQF